MWHINGKLALVSFVTALGSMGYNYFDYYETSTVAFWFTLASGISLPIGALLGILVTPVRSDMELVSDESARLDKMRKDFVGLCLAFGAGALLFAVTVELYGKQMRRLQDHGYTHGAAGISATTLGAIVGGVLYTFTNRWLCGESEDEEPLFSYKSPELQPLMPKVPEIQQTVSVCARDKKSQDVSAALSLYLGIVLDGIPEGVLLGFLSAEKQLSVVLVVSLFIANFPEAFSSSSMLRGAGWPIWKILTMWWTVCFLTAALAWVACLSFPRHAMDDEAFWIHMLEASVEGLAGGAMLACITSVMLPEAYEVHRDMIGLMALFGFLAAVVIKVVGGIETEMMEAQAAGKDISSLGASSLLFLGLTN